MKVAVVTQFPENPDSPHGGVEAVSVNLVGALSKLEDMEVHVVTTWPDKDTVRNVDWRGVLIHGLPRLAGKEIANATGPGRKQIMDYLRRLSPDVVHAHDTYGIMVKGLEFPRVFTIHGFIYGDTLLSGKKFAWIRSRLWRWVETGAWADQPHIISISPYVRERLGGIAKGVIHDIDNPISESFFHVEKEGTKNIIFSAAVINPRKNTLKLVEAFGLLVRKGYDAELRLAGVITDKEYGDKLVSFIGANQLEDRVHLLGRLSTDQIREELSSAAVFALVSLEENSPMGIEEAMAASVPVVTSNRCGMPYMVRNGVTGFLVDPFREKDIARRLEKIITDSKLRSEMGRRSREIAIDRFHPDSVAQRTKDVYLDSISDYKEL